MPRNIKYTAEAKIRFHTKEGVETFNAFKSFIRSNHMGSINANMEDLAINFMKDSMVNKVAQNEVIKAINKGFETNDKKLSSTVRKELNKANDKFELLTLPMGYKLTILLNLLADKDVIDEIRLNDPKTQDLQDPMFISELKAKIKQENLNKESHND